MTEINQKWKIEEKLIIAAKMQENCRKRTPARLNSLEYQITHSEGPFKASCHKQCGDETLSAI